jgi:hypothetical protein
MQSIYALHCKDNSFYPYSPNLNQKKIKIDQTQVVRKDNIPPAYMLADAKLLFFNDICK